MCINWGAFQRRQIVIFFEILGLILFIIAIVFTIRHFMNESFEECTGAFGDTFSLNLTKHKNYLEFKQGMCGGEFKERYSDNDDHKFPFIARLATKNNSQIFCGGSLISKKLVLTAAHCVEGKSNRDMQVYLGTGNNLADLKVFRNFEIIIHPKYSSSTFANDIALIKFQNSVKLHSKINLICLPFEDENVPVNLTLSEYVSMSLDDNELADNFIQGSDKYNCSKQFLEHAKDVRLHQVCENEANDENENLFYKPIDPLNQFCAGNRTLAVGNSGMPAYSVNQATKILGIVSFGTKMNDTNAFPTVYTKVHSYIHWILCKASTTS